MDHTTHNQIAKHLCKRIVDCKNRTPEVFHEGEYLIVRTSNVKSGKLIKHGLLKTDERNYRIWTERGAPEKDDVFFTREAPAGEACIFDGTLPICMGQRMMYFRTDPSILGPQFLVHTIYEGPTSTYIEVQTNGSTVGHLRLPQVYSLPVLAPPVGEQERILRWLEDETRPITTTLARARRQIERMQEYRTALIAEAVTGKIEVGRAVEH